MLNKVYDDRPERLRDKFITNYETNERHAWDIEDLVNVAQVRRLHCTTVIQYALQEAGPSGSFCPYFATNKVLKPSAELIICPYNYLIGPLFTVWATVIELL